VRRRPNPWIAVPSLVAGLLAGFVGWLVTDVSCRVELEPGVVQSCPVWSSVVALILFLGATIGVAVVLVLVFRSIAEARDRETRLDPET
jgi:hypothetical protein